MSAGNPLTSFRARIGVFIAALVVWGVALVGLIDLDKVVALRF